MCCADLVPIVAPSSWSNRWRWRPISEMLAVSIPPVRRGCIVFTSADVTCWVLSVAFHKWNSAWPGSSLQRRRFAEPSVGEVIRTMPLFRRSALDLGPYSFDGRLSMLVAPILFLLAYFSLPMRRYSTIEQRTTAARTVSRSLALVEVLATRRRSLGAFRTLEASTCSPRLWRGSLRGRIAAPAGIDAGGLRWPWVGANQASV